MAKQPSIREFPHDDKVWEIAWLGDVEQTGHEPKIDVHLSHVPYFDEPEAASERPATDVIQVGIGQLPYLCTGSSWRNGERTTFDPRAVPSQRLKDIRFDESNIQRIFLHHVIGERIDQNGMRRNLWLVPPYAHAIPRELGKTRCFAIGYRGDPYGVVVPAHEVVRFYYGQSSDLALAMFRGTLSVAPREVWDLERCSIDQVDGRRLAMITRAKKMADNDCWVLGRIFGDDYARRGAHGIYESLLRASANRERCFVDTDIPFRGTASWTVRAVKIGSGGQTRWLVLEILRCSGEFPFDDLAVIADNDNEQVPNDDSCEEKFSGFTGLHVAAREDADDEVRSDGPPRAGIRQITLLNPAGCYEALEGKRILDPPPKQNCRYRSAESWSTVDGLADMSTGLGTHGESSIKPAEVVMNIDETTDPKDEELAEATREKERQEALRATFENLAKIAAELDALEGVTAQIRESKQVAWIPLTAEPHKRQWAWLDSATQQRRAVMVVDVAIADRFASVIEFQHRAGESCTLGIVIMNGPAPLNDAAVVSILRDLAQERGIWKNVEEPRGIRISGLKHTRPSAGSFASAIIEAIDN